MRLKKGFREKHKGKKRFYPACDYPLTRKRLINVRGLKIWVETEGKGDPPVILLHGGPGGNHCYFHPALSGLSEKHLLVYYDMRGHYMSPFRKKSRYGVIEDAKDVEELRKTLGLGKIALLGHSYGGIVAFEYALRYPQRLSSLILCSAPVFWSDKDREKLYNTSGKHIAFEKAWEKCKSEKERTALYYKWSYFGKISGKTKKYNELSRQAYSTRSAGKLMAEYEKDSYVPRWNRLRKIKTPKLILFGKHDPDIRPHNAISKTAGFRDTKVLVFGKSKHDIFTDEPEKFRRETGAFLSRNNQRAP